MFVASANLGKVFSFPADEVDSRLVDAPPGYDSVAGLVDTDGHVFSEHVLYADDAIDVRFFVQYSVVDPTAVPIRAKRGAKRGTTVMAPIAHKVARVSSDVETQAVFTVEDNKSEQVETQPGS
jgi:hypothetical protein